MRSVTLQLLQTDRLDQEKAIEYVLKCNISIPLSIDPIEKANRAGLYIPRHLFLEGDISTFVNLGLYWIGGRKDDITLEKLYLTPSNSFQRNAGRNLLREYDDETIYYNLGVCEDYYFPKRYNSKREQLDGLVSFTLSHYGYYRILTYTHPIILELCIPTCTIFQEEDLIKKRVDLHYVMKRPDIRAKRLYIQIKHSFHGEEWDEFLSWGENLEYDTLPLNRPKECKEIPIGYISMEDNYNLCLTCRNIRDDKDFALCGHAVCKHCRVVKCPFCSLPFTCDSISNEDLIQQEKSFNIHMNVKRALWESREHGLDLIIHQYNWFGNDTDSSSILHGDYLRFTFNS